MLAWSRAGLEAAGPPAAVHLQQVGGELTHLTVPDIAGQPHVGAAQIRAAAPEVVLLPDKPYLFTAGDGPEEFPPSASCSSRAGC